MPKRRSTPAAAVPSGPELPGTKPERRAWRAALLLALGLIAYLPLWRAGFIWDDDSMLTANPLIRAGDGLYQFWCTRNALDYWPVTSTTLWVEWRLWGLHPLGYHLTNLALHLAEVLLLWSVLRRLRVPGAWLAALLFAVHPLNVESVTWIAERKNLLAMLFYLLSIRWFLETGTAAAEGAAERPAPSRRWYGLSLLAFVLAMLSKGSVATLPLVLAGIVAWRRRLTRADLLRLVPFFAVAAALAAVDVWFQRHGMPEVIRSAGLLERLLGAGAVVWFYLYKALWPAHLIFVYPQWRIEPGDWRWWLPLLGALGLTALLWRRARQEGRRPAGPGGARAARSRGSLFAWLYFCVSLGPVLGFTDVYFMKFSLVADHYAHLALIGVAAWAGSAVARRRERAAPGGRLALAALVALAVAALSGLTWRQNRMYRDGFVLYRTILAQNPDCWLAHNNLGQLLDGLPGQAPAARAEYAEALRLKPDYPEARKNLGLELAKLPGQGPAAIAQFSEAIRLKPNYAQAHDNLANELAKLPGRLPEALTHYAQAVRLDPGFAEARNNFGLALARTPGQELAAVEQFEAALRLNPVLAPAHYNLALVLAQLPGRLPEALEHYQRAVELDPDFAAARVSLAMELAKLPGRLPEAVAQYEAALRIDPNDADTENNLAVALARLPGRADEALAHFERALRLSPNDADLHFNLANQLVQDPARLPAAIAQYEAALRLRPDFPAAHVRLALAYGRSGRLEDAIAQLERALELDPADAAARELLGRLRSLPR